MKVFVIAIGIFLLFLTIINKISIRLGFRKAHSSQKTILLFGLYFSASANLFIMLDKYYNNVALFSKKLLGAFVFLWMFDEQYRRRPKQ